MHFSDYKIDCKIKKRNCDSVRQPYSHIHSNLDAHFWEELMKNGKDVTGNTSSIRCVPLIPRSVIIFEMHLISKKCEKLRRFLSLWKKKFSCGSSRRMQRNYTTNYNLGNKIAVATSTIVNSVEEIATSSLILTERHFLESVKRILY